VRRNGYPIGIVGRLGGFLLVGMLGSTALAAPALARNQPRDRDEQKPSLSISVEVGAVKVAADAQAPTADDPDASVSVSAPAVPASVSVDSSAASVDVEAPTGSASVSVNAGSAPAISAAVRSASRAPLQPLRVDGVDTRRLAEPTSHPLPVAAREAPPAVFAAAPVGVVAAPARVHPVPAIPKPRPTVRHKAPFGQSGHPVTRPRQPRELLSPSVVRSDRVQAVSVFSGERPLVSLLDTPRSAFSAPAAPAEAALAPAGRDSLRNASDLFGRSGAALGAGSAALLLLALVTAFALAAPRGLWPRSLVELAPQPALPSLLERPG
jgi:hypothetical protein